MFEKIKQLLDWVYRKNCYICKKITQDSILYDECYEDIEINESPQPRMINGVKLYQASIYIENLRTIIKALKYHNKKELAKPIAKIIFEYWKKLPKSNEEYEIIAVPLYKDRQKKRKYNHMSLVAEELSKLTGYSINNELVTRIKDTKPQYKLSRKERIKNLKNAFKVHKEKYTGKKLLLIDDICTTGTTMEELISALQKEKINDLCAIVSAVPQSVSVYQY